MFLRPHTPKKNGTVYEYWTLEESVRTKDGPRQRTGATLGKLPGLDEEVGIGWEQIRDVLDGRVAQGDLFRSEPEPPVWARVDTSRARVERLRRFGEVYLGLALWRRLKLDTFFDEAMPDGREAIGWGTMACILTLARFCAPSSELQIAEFWYAKTALDDLLGVAPEQVNEDRLYRALDALLPHKEGLFRHFEQVYGESVRNHVRSAALRHHLDVFRGKNGRQPAGQARLFARRAPGLRAGVHRAGGDARRPAFGV